MDPPIPRMFRGCALSISSPLVPPVKQKQFKSINPFKTLAAIFKNRRTGTCPCLGNFIRRRARARIGMAHNDDDNNDNLCTSRIKSSPSYCHLLTSSSTIKVACRLQQATGGAAADAEAGLSLTGGRVAAHLQRITERLSAMESLQTQTLRKLEGIDYR